MSPDKLVHGDHNLRHIITADSLPMRSAVNSDSDRLSYAHLAAASRVRYCFQSAILSDSPVTMMPILAAETIQHFFNQHCNVIACISMGALLSSNLASLSTPSAIFVYGCPRCRCCVPLSASGTTTGLDTTESLHPVRAGSSRSRCVFPSTSDFHVAWSAKSCGCFDKSTTASSNSSTLVLLNKQLFKASRHDRHERSFCSPRSWRSPPPRCRRLLLATASSTGQLSRPSPILIYTSGSHFWHQCCGFPERRVRSLHCMCTFDNKQQTSDDC